MIDRNMDDLDQPEISMQELPGLLQILEEEYRAQIEAGLVGNLDRLYPPGSLVVFCAAELYYKYQSSPNGPLVGGDFFLRWPGWPLIPLHMSFRQFNLKYEAALERLIKAKIENAPRRFFHQFTDVIANKDQTGMVLRSFTVSNHACILLLLDNGDLGWIPYRRIDRPRIEILPLNHLNSGEGT